MKQKRNYTLTEQEENKIVNQIYNKKILLILKSASNLNGNLNCSKELEHYAS